MKLEALAKAAAAARNQARRLEKAAQQAKAASQVTKDKARQAKTKLKLAKREAKQSRQAAKEAKGACSDAQRAAEQAAAKAASLEKKLQKSRKKKPQAQAQTGKPGNTPAQKRVAARPHSPAAKLKVAKVSTRQTSGPKPVGSLNSVSAEPAASGKEASIQVPRDLP